MRSETLLQNVLLNTNAWIVSWRFHTGYYMCGRGYKSAFVTQIHDFCPTTNLVYS